MIPFRKITSADVDTILSYFSGEEKLRAVKALRNVGPNDKYDLSVAIIDGMLVLRQEASSLYVYSMPVGPGNLRLVLMQLMEDADRIGYDWLIVGIRQEEQAKLRAALPHHFKISGEEKFSYLDMMRFGRRIIDDTLYVAVPVKGYTDSVFCNNEPMVPTVGEFGA